MDRTIVRLRSRFAVILGLAAMLGWTACGGGGDGEGGKPAAGDGSGSRTAALQPPPRGIDPCLVVDPDEAGKILGKPFVTQPSNGPYACTLRSGKNPQVALGIHVEAGRDGTGMFETQRKRGSNVSVDGVGDGAFVFVSPAGFANLSFIQDKTLVQLSLSAGGRDLQKDVTALARSAARRIAAGEALQKIPGLEALGGTWEFDRSPAGKSRADAYGVDEIAADGGWSRRTAAPVSGAIDATGGRWALRHPLGAADEGKYKIQGANAFTTTGAIEAKMQRVPCGEPPARVDPFLARRFGATRATVQRGQVDPGLVGLWEGSGKRGGEAVDLLWSITDKGDAAMLFVTREEGKVRAADGLIRFDPRKGRGYEGLYAIGGDKFSVTDAAGTTYRYTRVPPTQRREPALRGWCP